MDADSRIFVAGHTGLIGSALVRRLTEAGCGHLLLRRHDELDLTDAGAVEAFFRDHKPQFVFLMAGRAARKKWLSNHSGGCSRARRGWLGRLLPAAAGSPWFLV